MFGGLRKIFYLCIVVWLRPFGRHVGKNEALCFCLVLWNLRNFNVRQDRVTMVHAYAWTDCTYIFLTRFSQDCRVEMWSKSVPRFFHVLPRQEPPRFLQGQSGAAVRQHKPLQRRILNLLITFFTKSKTL